MMVKSRECTCGHDLRQWEPPLESRIFRDFKSCDDGQVGQFGPTRLCGLCDRVASVSSRSNKMARKLLLRLEAVQERRKMNGSFDMVLGNEWSKVLSPRECEVAVLVARGLSNKEVARKLGLNEGTVKIHLHSIFQKIGAKSRYRLISQSFPMDAAE
jgi:DNA-binding NarL/FixJ family response regulator